MTPSSAVAVAVAVAEATEQPVASEDIFIPSSPFSESENRALHSVIRRIFFTDDESRSDYMDNIREAISPRNRSENEVLEIAIALAPTSLHPPHPYINNYKDISRNLTESPCVNMRCKICLDMISNITFAPCGHLCSCSVCSLELRYCPICRSLIKQKIKCYF